MILTVINCNEIGRKAGKVAVYATGKSEGKRTVGHALIKAAFDREAGRGAVDLTKH